VRVLLDHNLPHKLRTDVEALTEDQIVTASYIGWGDLKNGELLRAAEEGGFEILVTGDQSLLYEQNVSGRQLAIIALSTNNWPIVKNYIPQILAAVDSAVPGSFQAVDCGTFSSRRVGTHVPDIAALHEEPQSCRKLPQKVRTKHCATSGASTLEHVPARLAYFHRRRAGAGHRR
jgi:hypothetical protein